VPAEQRWAGGPMSPLGTPPRVSIVTPSYNQAQYLVENLASVAGQAGAFEVEHIVVDGGSTDGSVAILQAYEEVLRETADASPNRGVRLLWSSEPDRGQSHAINKGLGLATGDVVAYLNSDDALLPGALATVVAAFRERPAANWLYGWCRAVDQDGRPTGRSVKTYKQVLGWRFGPRRLVVANYIPQPATFWRRSALARVGLFDESLDYTMDFDYWLRLTALLGPALPVHRDLAIFRWHAESKSTRKRADMFAEGHTVAARYCDDPWLLWVARLHDEATVTAYAFGERLRRLNADRSG
jgi:GT2 family glycosyltransferase